MSGRPGTETVSVSFLQELERSPVMVKGPDVLKGSPSAGREDRVTSLNGTCQHVGGFEPEVFNTAPDTDQPGKASRGKAGQMLMGTVWETPGCCCRVGLEQVM